MKKHLRWSLTVNIIFLICLLSSATGALAYVFGQVGPGPTHPSDGTVTFISFLKTGGKSDDQILTEDNWACDQGLNQGYQSSYFLIQTDHFDDPPASTGDSLIILLTGIGGENGKIGSRRDTLNTDFNQNLGSSTWGTNTTNPTTPIGLVAQSVSPGVVDLLWHPATTQKGVLTYRIYRSVEASGAGNGYSNGRYSRIARGIADTTYRDNTAINLPEGSDNWYVVVAADSVAADAIYLSGHSQETWADAALATELSSFMAAGGAGMVTLEWTTESEWNNQGFHIERREETGQSFSRITQELIAGVGNSSGAHTYTWVDLGVEGGRTYWYRLQSIDFLGTINTYGPVSATPTDALPETFQLDQNYPNPFNPETWIRYQVPQREHVSIKIYNVRGQLVTTLVDDQQVPGIYSVCWNGRDHLGQKVGSGVYFCRLRSDPFTTTIKMVLLQ